MDAARPSTVSEIFRNVYSRASSGDAEIAHLIAMITATAEYIKATNPGAKTSDGCPMHESPVAFLGALLTALERSGAEHAKDIFYLLSVLLPHVSPTTRRSQSATLCAVFSSALAAPAVGKNEPAMRRLLTCVGDTLAALDVDAATWSREDVTRLCSSLLNSCVHSRPKVRKAGHAAALVVAMAGHAGRLRAAKQDEGDDREGGEGAAPSLGCAVLISSFFVRVLSGGTQADLARMEPVLPLLTAALPLMPTTTLSPVVDALLKLPGLGQQRLAVAAYTALAELLESHRSRLPLKFVDRLARALSAARPSPDDHVPATQYAYTLAAAMTRLASTERIKAGSSPEVRLDYSSAGGTDAAQCVPMPATGKIMPLAVAALVQSFLSDRIKLQHSTANALSIILVSCVDARTVQEAMAALPPSGVIPAGTGNGSGLPVLLRLMPQMEQLLQFQYQPSWPISLPLLAVFLRLLGSDALALSAPLLRTLVSLHDAVSKAADAAAAARAAANEDEDEDEDIRRKKRGRRERNEDDAGSDAGAGGGGMEKEKPWAGSQALAVERTLQRVIAAGIRSVGMHGFVRAVGLTRGAVESLPTGGTAPAPSSVPIGCIHESRTWLLPALTAHGSASPVPLSFFHGVLLPIIHSEEAASAAALSAHKGGLAVQHASRARQVWALLPPIMVAAPDFSTPTGFNIGLGKILCSALTDPNRPEVTTVAARALETAIVRHRAAAGLSVVDIHATDAEGGADGEDGDAGLTVLGGGRKRGKDKDEDEDADGDEEGKGGPSPDNGQGDGTTVVFGAGGVSVYASGEAADPRHPLIISALRGGAPGSFGVGGNALPSISMSAATAGLATLQGYAKNYLPVLFNAYEMAILGQGSTAAGPAVPVQLSTDASNARSRKVLDAAAAYLSLAPPDLLSSMTDRLLKMLAASSSSLSSARDTENSARAAHRVAEEAAGKGASRTATAATGAALKAGKLAVQVASARTCSLLTLTLAVVPALPPVVQAVGGKTGNGKGSKGATEAAAAPPTTSIGTVDRIYEAIGPALSDTSSAGQHAQKRAYAVLTSILTNHPAWVRNGDKAATLSHALVDSLQIAAAPARRARLRTMRPLLRSLDLSNPAIRPLLPPILGEVILCVKHDNAKVRLAAYEVLLLVGHRMFETGGEGGGASELGAVSLADGEEDEMAEGSDDDDDEDEEGEGVGGSGAQYEDAEDAATAKGAMAARRPRKNTAAAPPAKAKTGPAPALMEEDGEAGLPPVSLTEFFRMLLAGLGANSPHMRSATVLALARGLYEFGRTEAVSSLAGPILDTVLLLLKEQARETVTSVVSFAKVVASCLPPEQLKAHTPRLLTALLVWSGEKKERIKAKIRCVVERLVRRVGYEAVAPHVPASDKRLVEHIKRMSDRRDRQRANAAAFAGGAGEGEGAEGTPVGGSGASALGGARSAFEDLLDEEDGEEYGDGASEWEGGAGGGAQSTLSRRGGGASVVSTASSLWPGTVAVPIGMRADRPLGGPGSRMSAVTSRMREGSTILTAAGASLPPVGTIADPGAMAKGSARSTAARTVISKVTGLPMRMLGGGSAAPSEGRERERAGRAGRVPTALLRSDDADLDGGQGNGMPLDLLDPTAMQAVVGSGSAAAAATIDARRRAAAHASDALGKGSAGFSGLRVGVDGRLIVPAEDVGEGSGVHARKDKSGGRKGSTGGEEAGHASDDAMDEGEGEGEGGAGRSGRAPRTGRAAAVNVEARDDEDEEGPSGMEGAKGRSMIAGRASRATTLSKPGSGHMPRIASAPQGWGMKKAKGGSAGAGGTQGGGGTHSGAPGARFASSKAGAGGDVRRKGASLEPFAYVPLDARAMSGGGGSLAVSRFSSVMAHTGGDTVQAGGRGSTRDRSQAGGHKRKR